MEKFIKDSKYSFWKQLDPKPFSYNEEYKGSQSTTLEMSYLRLGFLLSCLSTDEVKELKNWKICDVGSGNGIFGKVCKSHFKYSAEYDLSGDTITKEELENTNWDVIVLTDVLEHYYDINDLFKIKFKYLFLSFPETPEVDDVESLSTWKHFKPNEHIWCLNYNGVKKWLEENNYSIVNYGNPEDLIRKSKDNSINITTLVARNDN